MTLRTPAIFLAAGLLAAPLAAQTGAEAVADTASFAAPVPAPAAPAPIVLHRDTPIELLAPSEVRSDIAPAGTRFRLRVNKPVMVEGSTVIPVGATAWGEVISAESSKGLGKSGKMSAKLLFVEVNGTQIPLEGESSAKGMGGGSGGMAVAFGGFVGLFHRGNNAKIKAGEIMTGFIGADVEFPAPAPVAQ